MKSTIPKHIWSRGVVSAVALGVLLAAAGMDCAMAQTTPEAAAPAPAAPAIDEAAWKYEFTPYLWMAGLQGNVQAGRLPKTSVDMSFSDVFKVLDFAAMGAFEARKQRWGMLFDAQYIKTSDSVTSSTTGGLAGVTRSAGGDVTIKQTILSAVGTYRVSDGPTLVDLLGGVRFTHFNVEANIGASLFAPAGQNVAGTVGRETNKSFTDAIVGVRVLQPIAERWTLMGYLDAGGGENDYTWQAIAGANYQFSKTISGKFGYRYLYADYRKDQLVYDMATKGFYLGVGIGF